MDKVFQPLDAEAGARLIEAVGSARFGDMLLQIATSICYIDELFGYIVVDGEEPRSIVSSSHLPDVNQRVESYMYRFYQHDPAVREIAKIEKGKSFVQRIALNDIIPYDYRDKCFVQPGFSEKLSFGWRGTGYLLVLSFYRTDNSDEEALSKLASLSNLTLAIMVRHHTPVNHQNIIELLERRIWRSFPELTRREREICARSLAGHKAAEIAAELDIGMGTVLTYRQRAYRRMGYTCVNDFLPMLVS